MGAIVSRRLRDIYQTVPWAVDALVDNLPELSGSVLCPCVGDGALLRRLQERRPDLGPFTTNDLDPAFAADFHGDATDPAHWRTILAGPVDWICENPPYGVEMEILKRAYEYAKQGVVLMSRISFLEPVAARGPWLAAHPPTKLIMLERYSFTGNGKSDSATTQWLVWSKVPVLGPYIVSAYGYKGRPGGGARS